MKKAKVAIVIVGMLVLLALANYAFHMDPTQLAARGVGNDAHDQGGADEHVEEAIVEITPLGPTGAPVTIEVFYADEASCREAFLPIMSEMNATYGDDVRVDFSDLTDVEVNERARQMTLKGMPGLTINGESIVNVPGAGAFDAVVFNGSPQDRSWNPGMLHKAIQSELTARGIEFEEPAGQVVAPPGDAHAGHGH